MSEFEIFKSDREQSGWPDVPPPVPPWRDFVRPANSAQIANQQEYRGSTYCPSPEDVRAVNAAIHLRRPLLLTGNPGSGKSSLAYTIAWRLKLGEVLYWPINSQTTIKDGLYQYDAISRLRDANLREKENLPPEQISDYISLGPLGTALSPRPSTEPVAHRPRVLLIDELDKGDIDLPNDLLDKFEEGCFDIDELVRIKDRQSVVELKTAYRLTTASYETIPVTDGHVQCEHFPIVVITSNEERQFPPAFLRRCLRHDVKDADEIRLQEIVKQHKLKDVDGLIKKFANDRKTGTVTANDQLLSALFVLNKTEYSDKKKLLDLILRDLKD